MALFGKKENGKSNDLAKTQKERETMQIDSIKVLGSGCKSCHNLYENTKKTISKSNPNLDVEYITDMQEIVKYGVMQMPALIINEKVVSSGKVLKPADIEKLLSSF